MLNAIMLNVIMLNVIMLNVSMLNAIMLNAIMLNVIMLNVTMPTAVVLIVVAPSGQYSSLLIYGIHCSKISTTLKVLLY